MATITLNPNPAPRNTVVTVSGTGYRMDAVQVKIHHPDGDLEEYGVGVWADGTLGPFPWLADGPGSYHFAAYQRRRNRKSLELMASANITVS